MNKTIETPYMVQRISSRYIPPVESRKGIDAHFNWDYMGRAEFEFGALGRALTQMRENANADIITAVKIEFNEKNSHGIVDHECKAYYTGPKAGYEVAKSFFLDQLGPRKIRLFEPSYIDESYKEAKSYSKCIGWWCIDDNRAIAPWALFKTDPDARQWSTSVYAIKPAATSR